MVAKVPKQLAEKYNVIALSENDSRLQLAMSDPMNFYAQEDIRQIVDMPLEVLLRHFIQARFIKPRTRVFQTDNFYATIDQNIRYRREVQKILENQRKRKNQTDKG